jgi:hypothetical protein
MSKRSLAAALGAAGLLMAAGAAPGRAQAAPWSPPHSAPAGKITFFLVDPASSGTGLLGRGTFTYEGREYRFEARGARLSRTSADTPPSLVGLVYDMHSVADLGGDYVSVGDPAQGLHWIRNSHGVVVELGNGSGAGKLAARDASTPIAITVIGNGQP